MSRVAEAYLENNIDIEREDSTTALDLIIDEYSEKRLAKTDEERQRINCRYNGIICSFGICDECVVTGRSY